MRRGSIVAYVVRWCQRTDALTDRDGEASNHPKLVPQIGQLGSLDVVASHQRSKRSGPGLSVPAYIPAYPPL